MAVLAVVASAALALLAWSQPWFSFTTAARGVVEARGDAAAPALAALAVASLALGAALTLAGPVFRVVFGVLQVAIGLALAATAVAAIVAPYESAGTVVTELTGVAGAESVESLVTAVAVTAWPFVAIFGAVVAVASGLWILATGRRWPGSTRRYQAVRLAPAEEPRSAAADWDALSGGDDPTDDGAPGNSR